jgi:hypothetical protein
MHDVDIAHHFPGIVDDSRSFVSLWLSFERHFREFVLHDREKIRLLVSNARHLKAFVTHDRRLLAALPAKVGHDVPTGRRFEEKVAAVDSKMAQFPSKVSPF